MFGVESVGMQEAEDEACRAGGEGEVGMCMQGLVNSLGRSRHEASGKLSWLILLVAGA